MMEEMKNKTITLTFADFQDLSTNAAAEVCAKLDMPELAAFSAMLLARLAFKLFGTEKLTIEEDN